MLASFHKSMYDVSCNYLRKKGTTQMKHTMKKTLALLLIVLLIAGTFSACGGGSGGDDDVPAGILDQLQSRDIIFEIEGAIPATWDEVLSELGSARWLLEGQRPLHDWDEIYEEQVFQAVEEYMTFNEIALHFARDGVLERRAKMQAFHDAGLTLDENFFDELLETHFEMTGETMEDLLELLDEIDMSMETFQLLNEVLEMERLLLIEMGESLLSQADVDHFVSENGILRAKHILIAGEDEETTAFAMELYEELAALEGDEFLTRFVELMDEYGEDPGMIANPEGYTFFPGVMVPSFYDGAYELEYYGLSEPVRSTFGYHIILRLPIDQSLPVMTPGGQPATLSQIAAQSIFTETIGNLRRAFVVNTTAAFDLIVPSEIFLAIDARVDALLETEDE